MSDARQYAVWPEPRSRSRSLKGSRPSVPHGTNFSYILHGNPESANNPFNKNGVHIPLPKAKKLQNSYFLRAFSPEENARDGE